MSEAKSEEAVDTTLAESVLDAGDRLIRLIEAVCLAAPDGKTLDNARALLRLTAVYDSLVADKKIRRRTLAETAGSLLVRPATATPKKGKRK